MVDHTYNLMQKNFLEFEDNLVYSEFQAILDYSEVLSQETNERLFRREKRERGRGEREGEKEEREDERKGKGQEQKGT